MTRDLGLANARRKRSWLKSQDSVIVWSSDGSDSKQQVVKVRFWFGRPIRGWPVLCSM